jgi:hypothetical protein
MIEDGSPLGHRRSNISISTLNDFSGLIDENAMTI